MAPHRSGNWGGGHAVIMTGCSPRSLTFLNSWDHEWGDNGSFSVESCAALELDDSPMRFYDVYWLESELTPAEKQAFAFKVETDLRSFSEKYPGILELQLCCPACRATTRLGDFEGTTRQLKCPHCNESFTLLTTSLVDFNNSPHSPPSTHDLHSNVAVVSFDFERMILSIHHVHEDQTEPASHLSTASGVNMM
ncbi:hypothetical protein J3F84DRAFT_180013 [Trichoderma pleuroticola]